MTLKEQVLEHLQGGETLTQLEALDLFGTTRLAPIIHTLIREGHPVKKEMVDCRDGRSAKVARYSLPPKQGLFGDVSVRASREEH